MPPSPGNEIYLRKLDTGDWQLWRKLRLQALEEAPYAFGATLAYWQGEGDTEARWRTRLSDVPFNLIAEWRQTPAGMASATSPNPDGSVELISMWVAPSARGRGVGDSLVTAILEWARDQHAGSVALAVFKTNERALALYRRHGFLEVGESSETAAERKMLRIL